MKAKPRDKMFSIMVTGEFTNRQACLGEGFEVQGSVSSCQNKLSIY